MSEWQVVAAKAIAGLGIQVFAFGIQAKILKMMGLVDFPHQFGLLFAGFVVTLCVALALIVAERLSANYRQTFIVLCLGVGVALVALPPLGLVQFSGVLAYLVAWVFACMAELCIAQLDYWVNKA